MDNSEALKKTEYLLNKTLSEGKTLQELASLPESHLEELYSLGYDFYNQGKIKESISIFLFLTGINPKSYKFRFALAAAYFKSEKYNDAVFQFSHALAIDQTNPLPGYYAVEALLKLNEVSLAKDLGNLTIEIAGNNQEYAKIKERIKIIINSLNIN